MGMFWKICLRDRTTKRWQPPLSEIVILDVRLIITGMLIMAIITDVNIPKIRFCFARIFTFCFMFIVIIAPITSLITKLRGHLDVPDFFFGRAMCMESILFHSEQMLVDLLRSNAQNLGKFVLPTSLSLIFAAPSYHQVLA